MQGIANTDVNGIKTFSCGANRHPVARIASWIKPEGLKILSCMFNYSIYFLVFFAAIVKYTFWSAKLEDCGRTETEVQQAWAG
jgi:hypothetical protein